MPYCVSRCSLSCSPGKMCIRAMETIYCESSLRVFLGFFFCYCGMSTSPERLPITTRIQAFMRMSNNPFKITQFQTIRSFADLGHQSFLFEKLIALHFALTTDQNCSIGLSSGEYGGK